MTANKQKRIRADIWTSLHPVIEAEVERSGLSAQEVINIALTDYFGLAPKGRVEKLHSAYPTPNTVTQPPLETIEPTDDYI